jgi:acyl carrier protein
VAAPVVRATAAPVAVRTVVAVPARVTIPAERKVVVTPSRNGNGAAHVAEPVRASAAPSTNGSSENGHHAHNGVNGNGSAIAKATPAPAAAPSSNGANLPSIDSFRAALLKAVSERTGYPEDMLDESLPLESGLGIDSIKTVEIFSNLKDYHRFFLRDGQDEEEALKEFTQLKTLGDIISSYELQHQALSAGAKSEPDDDSASGPVERYAVEAVEAPALNGKKKSSRLVT